MLRLAQDKVHDTKIHSSNEHGCFQHEHEETQTQSFQRFRQVRSMLRRSVQELSCWDPRGSLNSFSQKTASKV